MHQKGTHPTLLMQILHQGSLSIVWKTKAKKPINNGTYIKRTFNNNDRAVMKLHNHVPIGHACVRNNFMHSISTSTIGIFTQTYPYSPHIICWSYSCLDRHVPLSNNEALAELRNAYTMLHPSSTLVILTQQAHVNI